jgi:hypothetical protein
VYAPAGLLTFVLQLRLQDPPARIEHGLGHPGLRQRETPDVPDDNRLVAIDD